MHVRRSSGSPREARSKQPAPQGSPWLRGGAICSIALLLLGGALVVYGGALMTFGHRPLPEGQAEQWQRIARIRLHQVQQENVASNKPPEQSNQQATETKSAEESDDPAVRHAAAKARQVFESIISSEELPRQPKSVGSLSEHLSSTGKNPKHASPEGGKAKPAKPRSKFVDSLEQIAAAHLSMAQHHRRD